VKIIYFIEVFLMPEVKRVVDVDENFIGTIRIPKASQIKGD
jgi:hypothetical protein